MFRFKSVFIHRGISLLGAVYAALSGCARAHGDEVSWARTNSPSDWLVSVQVRPGESILNLIQRVHPCPGNQIKIPDQIFVDNPERPDSRGNMILSRRTAWLPKSFLDPKIQCLKHLAPVPSPSPLPEVAISPLPTAPVLEPLPVPSAAVPEPSVRPELPEPEASPQPSSAPDRDLPSNLESLSDEEIARYFAKVKCTDPDAAGSASGASSAAGKSKSSGYQAEAPLPTKEELDAFVNRVQPHPKNVVWLMGAANVSRIASVLTNGMKPVLNSLLQPALLVGYRRELSNDWTVGVRYRYQRTQFKEVTGLKLTAQAHSAMGAQGEARYRVTRQTHMQMLLGAREVQQYSVGKTRNLLEQNVIRIAGALSVLHAFGSVAGFDTWGSMGIDFFLPPNFSPSLLGVGDTVQFTFDRKFSPQWGARVLLSGSYDRYQTDTEAHSELSLSLGLGLSFGF